MEGDSPTLNQFRWTIKEICKCHHQNYLNTKTVINYTNKSSCLEEKCKLTLEKNNDSIETCIEFKNDSKVTRNNETESVEKTTSWE